MTTVSILFARRDSVYRQIDGTDVWDIDRDARNWPGGNPCICHPPCRAWGRLRHFANPRPDEKALALFAVVQVRRWGGVLEHPASSTLWDAAQLPPVGERDLYGGFTVQLNQAWFGHRAEKKTWLYFCGIAGLPEMPIRLDYPSHLVASKKRAGSLPEISKAEREHTPVDFARWLVAATRTATEAS